MERWVDQNARSSQQAASDGGSSHSPPSQQQLQLNQVKEEVCDDDYEFLSDDGIEFIGLFDGDGDNRKEKEASPTAEPVQPTTTAVNALLSIAQPSAVASTQSAARVVPFVNHKPKTVVKEEVQEEDGVSPMAAKSSVVERAASATMIIARPEPREEEEETESAGACSRASSPSPRPCLFTPDPTGMEMIRDAFERAPRDPFTHKTPTRDTALVVGEGTEAMTFYVSLDFMSETCVYFEELRDKYPDKSSPRRLSFSRNHGVVPKDMLVFLQAIHPPLPRPVDEENIVLLAQMSSHYQCWQLHAACENFIFEHMGDLPDDTVLSLLRAVYRPPPENPTWMVRQLTNHIAKQFSFAQIDGLRDLSADLTLDVYQRKTRMMVVEYDEMHRRVSLGGSESMPVPRERVPSPATVAGPSSAANRASPIPGLSTGCVGRGRGRPSLKRVATPAAPATVGDMMQAMAGPAAKIKPEKQFACSRCLQEKRLRRQPFSLFAQMKCFLCKRERCLPVCKYDTCKEGQTCVDREANSVASR